VLINLIDNAIKFNDNSGKVIIQVEEIFNKNLFYINVIDSGVGISP
jgi:signal transduction histidine kinase